jgi:hypothetical protein
MLHLRSRIPPAVFLAVLGILPVIHQWASARPLWLDEEMIALNVRDRRLNELSGVLWFDQTAPLGWLILQHLAGEIFGSSELALRAVPSLFGLATVACAAWVGHRWMATLGTALFVLVCSFGQWISFYAVELKHYSADTFWGLFLPSLTVWTAESDRGQARQRLAAWGACVAVGHWLSNGALLVVPTCGALLGAVAVFRRDVRLMKGVAAIGLIWMVSFGVHYELAIRHARESSYLREFWAFALPPPSASPVERTSWVWSQLPNVANKPGGTDSWVMLWSLSAAGFVFSRARLLGISAGSVVLWGLMLSAVGIVPLYERLTLWFLPALYLGMALLADGAEVLVRKSSLRRQWLHIATASLIAVTTSVICLGVVLRGIEDWRTARPANSNRAIDDRSAVSWLMAQRRPGDSMITTRFGLPAVWWYAQVPIGADAKGSRFPDGGPIFVAEHHARGHYCGNRELHSAIGEGRRLLVYLGFEDTPKGFDDLLLDMISNVGSVTIHHFGQISRAAIVDPSMPARMNPFWEDAGREGGSPLPGCIALREARRW